MSNYYDDEVRKGMYLFNKGIETGGNPEKLLPSERWMADTPQYQNGAKSVRPFYIIKKQNNYLKK